HMPSLPRFSNRQDSRITLNRTRIERNLCENRLQIGRLKGWITLESGLATAVPHWKRCPVFPDAWNNDVIAKIPTDTRKMLHDIDPSMVQFAPIADAR